MPRILFEAFPPGSGLLFILGSDLQNNNKKSLTNGKTVSSWKSINQIKLTNERGGHFESLFCPTLVYAALNNHFLQRKRKERSRFVIEIL